MRHRCAHGVEFPLCYSDWRRGRWRCGGEKESGTLGKQKQGELLLNGVWGWARDALGQGALDSVDVALDPSEMEGMDEQALKDKYDDYVKEQRKANSSSLPDDAYEEEKKGKKKKSKVIVLVVGSFRDLLSDDDEKHDLVLLLLRGWPLLTLAAVGQQEGQRLPLLTYLLCICAATVVVRKISFKELALIIASNVPH